MKAAVAALCLALATGPAIARTWTENEVIDLQRAAYAAEQEGLPLPAQALGQLALARHLDDIAPIYANEVDWAADGLFETLAAAYARGSVEPASADVDWHVPRPPAPDMAALTAALDAGVAPREVLARLLPSSDDYRALRAELARLLALPEGADERRRIDQVRANLERWRWLPRQFPARRVEVRIAQYELLYYRGDGTSVKHAVIVGARRTPSPTFEALIVTATINPDWVLPSSIITELLPRFRRNPASAEREGYEVLGDDGRVVDPSLVNWRARPFPYRLRQRPGPANALGRVRLDMPNPYAVYLHDTPSRTLFARSERALSHGCIRVENPVALAAALLAAPEWDDAGLQAVIETGATQTVTLTEPSPVFVLYLTTGVQPDGSLAYYEDIYRRDDAIVAALDRAPTPETAFAAAAGASECGHAGDARRLP
jgi:murein L,D-transpeptidase YcbB/YkuD